MKAIISTLAPLGWMGLIFVLSSQSDVPGPLGLSAEVLAIAGHLFMFGVLAFLVFRALTPWVRGLGGRAVLAFAFTVLYGVSDEIHQSFVAGRDASPFDIAVDAIGAAVVLLATVTALRRWEQARDE
jgi:VanZ family protein